MKVGKDFRSHLTCTWKNPSSNMPDKLSSRFAMEELQRQGTHNLPRWPISILDNLNCQKVFSIVKIRLASENSRHCSLFCLLWPKKTHLITFSHDRPPNNWTQWSPQSLCLSRLNVPSFFNFSSHDTDSRPFVTLVTSLLDTLQVIVSYPGPLNHTRHFR